MVIINTIIIIDLHKRLFIWSIVRITFNYYDYCALPVMDSIFNNI